MDLTSETSATIEAIYDTVLDPAAWPEALRSVRELIGGAGGVAFQLRHGSGAITFWVSENLGTADQDNDYVKHLNSIAPRIGPGFTDPPGVPSWDYRIIEEREMDRHEFYDGIERLSGVRYFVGMRPVVIDNESLLVAVNRTRKQGHFDEKEIALYAQVAPHIGHVAFFIPER